MYKRYRVTFDVIVMNKHATNEGCYSRIYERLFTQFQDYMELDGKYELEELAPKSEEDIKKETEINKE